MKTVVKNCAWCNKEFNALIKEINRGAAKFCSRSCSSKKINSLRVSLQPKEIFFSNITKTPSGCWEYKRKNNKGYGRLTINRKSVAAHRFSYELHFGTIDKDILVCHHCDNPPCVNPLHLFLGTSKENTHDMLRKKRKVVVNGEKNNLSKLSSSDVIEIKNLLASGLSYSQIAPQFNVCRGAIGKIARGESWKHLD